MKRSRIGGQVRLSWGGGDNLSTNVETRHRRQKNNDMWTDQYAPAEVADLCVAPKKVKQVQEWLDDYTTAGMMILVGSPGIGKSTMVKLLCGKVHEWTEEPSCSSPLQSFCDFLQQSMYLDAETTVLLDELPYLHNDEMRQSFRQALADHVLQCHRKIIWVYSNTMGGSHQPKELASLLDPQILYHSGRVKILQIHPVTTAKMKKVLQKVCVSNRVALPDVTAYNGDLRHALLSLQFSSSTDGLRDTRLSPFHALGKLLYAKRRLITEQPPSGRRPLLDFVPEEVVAQSGMPLFSSIYFLQGHAPDFFTDVNELAVAFGTYSDACMFLNTPLEQYSISLAGRAASTANWSPAPSKFRSFSSPLIFEVNRKARANRNELELLLSCDTSQINFGSFVTDDYPFLRRIHPHAVSTRGLQSHLDEEPETKKSVVAEAELLIAEQAAILALDDIEDFSDDDEVKVGPDGVHTLKQEPEIIIID